MKLVRCLQEKLPCTKAEARRLVGAGKVTLDGHIETDGTVHVPKFARVEVEGRLLQSRERIYVLLNKPAGYVSATSDTEKKTVMDLLPEEWRDELHIVGRLDKETTGLLLLTNDGDWGNRLAVPEEKVGKRYRVWTELPITDTTTDVFSTGIYLAYEDITTMPAELEIVGKCEALLTLYEGKYHQVKRMFHAVGNRVVKLHREAVGDIDLPADLSPGDWGELDLST